MKAVVCAADGTILRSLEGNPALFAAQAGPGEFIMALEHEGGPRIDDTALRINEIGEFELTNDAPPDAVIPPGELYLVPSLGDQNG